MSYANLTPTAHVLKSVNQVLKCEGTFTAETVYKGKQYTI